MEMDVKILVVNAGSSSIKCALFGKNSELIWKKNLDLKEDNFEALLNDLSKTKLEAIGHRIVHGGEKFVEPAQLTPEVIQELEKISFLAPLHNPANLQGVALTQKFFPHVLQLGVFDTAFHHTLPDYVYTYPLPLNLKAEGVRKYGFHGISHEYSAHAASKFLGKNLADLKLIICHLGAGCSLCAVKEGKSLDTTMGMTPLEGLMMVTRSGSIDPSILFFLEREKKLSVKALEKLLNHESGLLGVSEISNDIREILKAQDKDPKADLSLKMFIHRLRGYIGMMMAALQGIDAIVFTGGIGENSSWVRQKTAEAFAFLGMELDSKKNDLPSQEEREISTLNAKIKALVIPTFEEKVIAQECLKYVSRLSQQSS